MTRTGSLSRRDILAGALAFTGLAGSRLWGDEPTTIPTVNEYLKQRLDAAPLSMVFKGTTADECRKWQAEFGAKLRSLLGPHTPPDKWKTVVKSTTELEDHRREELVLVADGMAPLPVYLLSPKGPAKRRPGVVGLHGHGSHGHHPIAGRDDLPGVGNAIKNAHYDYGRQLAQRGYVVACPCFTPFGVRLGNAEAFGKQDPCGDTFIRMQLLGKLLIAENLRDSLWALELLARNDGVDATKLGCVGLSYGGRMTMMTAAVEPRVRVAVVSGALNMMQERVSKPYSCGAQIIPGLLTVGDVPEIAALIAPRHCLWEVGQKDTLIPPRWADEALTRMRRAWKALDAEDRLQVDRHEGGHVWNGTVAYSLLEKVLG
ncbi:hypothetical protein AYO44_09440 [Planctomycetaceae bacterium SCGC AG-212-F19]|nr:hypothetical protein AYO44_09440 [Planctomycetaceae bacterium SCGC AG-212-F19]